MKRYTIATLQKSVPPWYDLDSEPDFTLQDETFKRGDFVVVKLYDKNDSNDEDDIAYIDDIKALPRINESLCWLVGSTFMMGGTMGATICRLFCGIPSPGAQIRHRCRRSATTSFTMLAGEWNSVVRRKQTCGRKEKSKYWVVGFVEPKRWYSEELQFLAI
jgi:hypothetical protein